jgi:hypothetical protein
MKQATLRESGKTLSRGTIGPLRRDEKPALHEEHLAL